MASTSSIQGLIECNDSIYMFPNQPSIPNAEIIFFHDVLWKGCEEPHVQSWTLSENPNVCWPEVLLKPKYHGSRIWYVRYDGSIRRIPNGGHMNLFQIAENLREDIVRIYAGNCPVFLIGHGFAGLIIKKLLQGMQLYNFANNQSQRKLEFFMENVKGICYFAPPFLGTKLVDSMKGLRHAGPLVEFLEVQNREISQLNHWFSLWRRDRGCNAIAIFASLPTELKSDSKMAFLHRQESTQVVEEASARYDIDKFYSSNRDHFGVCKLGGEVKSSLHMLTDLIEQVIPARACGFVEHVADRIEGACNEFVTNTLNQLWQQEAIFLSVVQLHKISKFPETKCRLMNGLTKAGFEASCRDGDTEIWVFKCQ